MPKIEIRPSIPADFPRIAEFDHGYKTNYVWQMDLGLDEGQTNVFFREVRLPRPVRVEFPRPYRYIDAELNDRSIVLVGVISSNPVGYIHVSEGIAPTTAWVLRLAVAEEHRRQGIASGLVLAAQDWARQRKNRRIIVEMQSKNLPAIRMSQKLGFEFCGYNDHYYTNQDIAVFFSQYLRL